MKNNKGKKTKLSAISRLHYAKLVLRSGFFLAALGVYILCRVRGYSAAFGGIENSGLLLTLIFVIYALEMILRCSPSSYESMGCQKQFYKNYAPIAPVDRKALRKRSWKTVLPVLLSWIGLNGIIAALYLLGLFDWGIMVLISLAYGVCDMICILFFCPFQTFMMKNKCCGSCRIYNWDYAMMFTPLIFVKNFFALGLVLLSLIVLFKWEMSFYLYPERFYEDTNGMLSCANCQEKLCHHKKQLRNLHAKWKNGNIFQKF